MSLVEGCLIERVLSALTATVSLLIRYLQCNYCVHVYKYYYSVHLYSIIGSSSLQVRTVSQLKATLFSLVSLAISTHSPTPELTKFGLLSTLYLSNKPLSLYSLP